MPFEQAHRLTSILLASASFIGLVLGAPLPEWLIVLTGSALIIALLRILEFKALNRIAPHVTLSGASWNLLAIIGFVGFWVDSVWISGELLPAGIHFILVLLIIKLFNLRLRRDYLHLYAISLVAILAAASLTADLWYLPIFLAYLLTGVWTLLLFHMTHHSGRSRESESAVPPVQESLEEARHITPQLFWLANGLAAVTCAATLAIFFVIPRAGAGFYQKGYGESIRTSGFSNTVDLGAMGPVKRDPSVVMRVELPDRAGQDEGRFYLRGIAFDRYNGRSWVNQLNHRRAMSESVPGTFTVHRSRHDAASNAGSGFRHNILLEPLDTPVLFAAPFADTISGKLPAVQVDVTGALYLPFPSSSRIEYSVVSRPNSLLPDDLQPQVVSYPESFLRHFLQIPVQSDRITALAQEIAQSKRTAYEKAVAIQEYLLSHYRYSLDAPLADQANPLEEFLFSRKTGYCEHYATAMVMLLRSIGIPARLVTGFLATEWNEYGSYYLVRQQDAHAWVEVHLPRSGWVMMDPTPASGESAGDAAPAWQSVGRMLDSFRLRWNRFFVQYSAADQLAVVRELQTGGTSAKNRAWDSLVSLFNPLVATVGKAVDYFNGNTLGMFSGYLGLVVIGLCALIWLGLKWPYRLGSLSRGDYREASPIAHLYRGMVQHLARKGISKPAAMAPLEFIRITREQWSEASSSVTAITELYCRSRFGRMTLTKEEFLLAQEKLRQLIALERAWPKG